MENLESIQARIARIVRYPIKGFAGQELTEAELVTGGGIRHDRSIAVRNGFEKLPQEMLRWERCGNFVRLTKNLDLLRYNVAFNPGDLTATLTSPSGEAVTLDMRSAGSLGKANATLADWFGNGPQGSPQLAHLQPDAGYWDHVDAGVSLINLASVDELSQAAGQTLDPLRFRANIYLTDLDPWMEFGLVGQRIQVGQTLLEVLRPIDRCTATSIDPNHADNDINVPLLLQRRVGHIFCGVYARVLRGGPVRVGEDIFHKDYVASGDRPTAPDTAPDARELPRQLRVASRVQEDDGVLSLRLCDPAGGELPAASAGQHIRLHMVAADGCPVWRAYSLSGVEEDAWRISVKRQGVGSELVHGFDLEAPIVVSGPFGRFVVPADGGRAVVFLTAGIGITPVAAMLAALLSSGDERKIYHVHFARNGRSLALVDEAKRCVTRLANGEFRLIVTQPQGAEAQELNALFGRRPLAELLSVADIERAHFVCCGPGGFLSDVRTQLAAQGVDKARIHWETFASPVASADGSVKALEPPEPGPFDVCFDQAGRSEVWRAADGSLLDLAEKQGLALPAGCRAGVCGQCRQKLVMGEVAYLSSLEADLDDGDVLLCCAVPISDVVIGA